MSQQPGQELMSNGVNFTPTGRHDTYPFIDSSKANQSGKHVLITGASKGIGRATALSFARAGASKIAIAARSDLSAIALEIQDAAKAAGKPAPAVLSLKLDVADRTDVVNAVAQIEKEFGRLDILINNAAYLEKFVPVGESDPDDWWRTWEVNLKGPYLVTHACLPLMLKGGDKIIIGVSSIGAHILSEGGSSYQTSKLALLRFTEFVQKEYEDQGIVTYCIHPGGVLTELARGLGEGWHNILTDKVELAADTLCWLTQEKREWLGGRYISANWDMQEMLAKKEDIVKGDLLKVRMALAL